MQFKPFTGWTGKLQMYVYMYIHGMYVCMLMLLQVLQKPDKMTAILVRFLPNGQVRIYIHVHAWYGVLDPMQHKACGVLAPYLVGWSNMADYSMCAHFSEHVGLNRFCMSV